MCDSSSLSARSSDDQSLLDRARRLRNGKLIEQIQSVARRQAALKGSKDGLEKFKGTSLPELRTPADYPKFDLAVRNALRPKRGGTPLLEYEAFREWKELGIDPPFEIKHPSPVAYDPLTATAEENELRDELERLEGASARTDGSSSSRTSPPSTPTTMPTKMKVVPMRNRPTFSPCSPRSRFSPTASGR